jgi:hypothetical protein
MAFMILFIDEPDEYPGDESTPWAVGRIVAGELDENFRSNLYEWDKHGYESQWLQSLERILQGDEKAVLITSYVNQRAVSNLEWWALYRGDCDTVHVQNHLPWFRQFEKEFSVADASNFLHDRVTVNEDGNRLSEWDVPLRDIELFVAQLKQQRTPFPK